MFGIKRDVYLKIRDSEHTSGGGSSGQEASASESEIGKSVEVEETIVIRSRAATRQEHYQLLRPGSRQSRPASANPSFYLNEPSNGTAKDDSAEASATSVPQKTAPGTANAHCQSPHHTASSVEPRVDKYASPKSYGGLGSRPETSFSDVTITSSVQVWRPFQILSSLFKSTVAKQSDP